MADAANRVSFLSDVTLAPRPPEDAAARGRRRQVRLRRPRPTAEFWRRSPPTHIVAVAQLKSKVSLAPSRAVGTETSPDATARGPDGVCSDGTFGREQRCRQWSPAAQRAPKGQLAPETNDGPRRKLQPLRPLPRPFDHWILGLRQLPAVALRRELAAAAARRPLRRRRRRQREDPPMAPVGQLLR